MFNSRLEADEVVIVPVHIDSKGVKRLVLCKEYRFPIRGYELGFAAGLIDKGESIVEAGIRELMEETGYDVVSVFDQSPMIYSSAGLTDESCVMLYVLCTGEDGKQELEENEHIEIIKYTPDELKKFMSGIGKRLMWSAKAWPIVNLIIKTGNFECIEG